MQRQLLLTCLLITKQFLISDAGKCLDEQNRSDIKFYLIKSFHRSLEERVFVDNVQTFEECIELAKKYKGLALNYAPRSRFQRLYKNLFIEQQISRDHFWNQPQLYFNCHILRCPENATFKTLINDSIFNYYSMYQSPVDSTHYVCLPEVGLFLLQTKPAMFINASSNCRSFESFCGTLPHVATRMRTYALTQLLMAHNEQQAKQLKSRINLAYVGLYYNRNITNKFEIINMKRESLNCFPYRAWEPGNPKKSSQFANESCVALTTQHTWKTMNCNRKLPYICEILTTCANEEEEY